ncbi:peritrophin-1-like isoform X2 [Malaya genurostris]|uniref:peritrophin-1-like isoform X2 n=1 Tax=Malaya genurostris TaxID=325434 RepID=UPI0026F3EF9E|nr:peritrophin-1-like isoform X2 [Malaya genurostris]
MEILVPLLLLTIGLIAGGQSSILCPLQFDPSVTVHLPHPTDCSKYLTCVGSTPVEQYCPAGLHWNHEANQCDYPRASRCSRGAAASERATFNLSDITVGQYCSPKGDQCPKSDDPKPNVVFLKHSDCRKFRACIAAEPVELRCPEDLYWNADSCVCDYLKDAECDESFERKSNIASNEVEVEDEAPIEVDNAENVEEPEHDQSVAELVEPMLAGFRFRRSVNNDSSPGSSEVGSGSSSGSGSRPPIQSGAAEHAAVSVAVLVLTIVMSTL